jgi:hypothetical protein
VFIRIIVKYPRFYHFFSRGLFGCLSPRGLVLSLPSTLTHDADMSMLSSSRNKSIRYRFVNNNNNTTKDNSNGIDLPVGIVRRRRVGVLRVLLAMHAFAWPKPNKQTNERECVHFDVQNNVHPTQFRVDKIPIVLATSESTYFCACRTADDSEFTCHPPR